jgi:acetyl esterase/lipase
MLAAILLLLLGVWAVAGTVNAARPARAWWLWGPSWLAAFVVTELALHLILFSLIAAAILVALGALAHTAGVVGLALLVACELAAIPLIWRARRTVVDFGDDIEDLDTDDAPRYPRSHVFFPWLALRRPGVRYERAVEYARVDGRPIKLDVYLPDGPAEGRRPALVEVHGGGWFLGTRKEQGIPLLTHMAANGWVCFNIDYRLSPWAQFPDHVVDVKRAVAWVREHAAEYGVDPDFIAITGGSAGGHLSSLAALTSDDKSLQPGFEDADTSVAAAVPFYGAYDLLDEDQIENKALLSIVLEPFVFRARRSAHPERFRDASPTHRVHAGAPPFLIIHGDRDSLLNVENARRFADRLREASENPVVYAEMKGAQHAFDFMPSWRTIPVVEAIERFLTALYSQHLGGTRPEGSERELEDALTD